MTFTPIKVGEPANSVLRLNYLFNKAYRETANPTDIRFARMWHHEAVAVVGQPVAVGSGAGYFPYHKSWLQSLAGINNSFENYFTLNAGTYNFEVLFNRDSASGIVTWSVDGTVIGTTDLYGSAVSYVRASIADVTISTSGKHTLTGTLASKNASSSGYVARLYKYSFREA